MGRIQKKKTSSKTKAKQTKIQKAVEPQNGNRTPAKSVSATSGYKQQPAKAPVRYPGKQYVDASIQFLREVRVELRKVTWPSRKQTIGSTVVVIVLVLIVSAFLGLVDFGLSSLINMVIQ
jgi:preprotein translocase subunit SecE